jgi:hypothetical protein
MKTTSTVQQTLSSHCHQSILEQFGQGTLEWTTAFFFFFVRYFLPFSISSMSVFDFCERGKRRRVGSEMANETNSSPEMSIAPLTLMHTLLTQLR